MQILVDENLSRRDLIAVLRSSCHDVRTVAEVLDSGAAHTAVAAAAMRDDRVLLTADCEDFRMLYAAVQTHPGVLLVYSGSAGMLPTSRIAAAVSNIANTYRSLADLMLALNDFLW
jgi:predicted nuclease of predicted toxin-antitoxin system